MKKRIAVSIMFFMVLLSLAVTAFADDLDVKLISHVGKTYIMSMTYPGLKPEYPVNIPENPDDIQEYFWGFKFTDGKSQYNMGTSHYKHGESMTMSLLQMQTDVWKMKETGGASRISKATLVVNQETLYWTFSVPDDFDQSNFVITEIEVKFYSPRVNIINSVNKKISAQEVQGTIPGQDTTIPSDSKTEATTPSDNKIETSTQKDTKLTAPKKTYKAAAKSKKYTVTLKDSKNKAIKNVTLTLKVNGKTYKAKTNSKGKATFNITKLKKNGTFTATIKFAGNKNYKAKTKNVKIKVKK